MSMFNDTITVYNKYVEQGTEKWKRVVLRGVFWSAARGAVLRRTGADSADSVVILIPRSVRSDGVFVTPMKWAAMSEKVRSWTLHEGDTVVKGAVSVEISRSAAKELSGLDDVYTITVVDDKDFGGLPHWEVSAK
jgi:hypothetical protein